jgi:hypothetical protein
VASRVGVDLHPVDVSDERQRRWLLACCWPEQPERLERLRAAIDLAVADPAPVVQGDAVERVTDLVASVAREVHPIIVATWALSYLSETQRVELVRVLGAIGDGRDLSLVFFEQPLSVSGLPLPARLVEGGDPRLTSLFWSRWVDGVRTDVRLADGHPHGRWIEWLVPPGELA